MEKLIWFISRLKWIKNTNKILSIIAYIASG